MVDVLRVWRGFLIQLGVGVGTGMWRWGRIGEDLERGGAESESEQAHGCEARHDRG